MFDQLVVSARQHRKHPTAKFFLATSMFYVSTVAMAFAVSVLVSDPKLADTGSVLTRIAQLPPAASDGTRIHAGPQSRVPPSSRPDLNNFMSLDTLIQHKGNAPPRIDFDPRSFGPGVGPSGGSNDAMPSLGVIEGDRTFEPPPKPDPPPQRPPAAAPAVENRPLRVSSSVLQGKAIERRTPPYPDLARQIRLPGEVSVEVIISPEGRVESARAVSGHPMLIKAALDAARGWRFEPTLLNGLPVRVTGVITFVFKLNDY